MLIDEAKRFVGLIDFNLSGKEPVLNYAVRAALWNVSDGRLYDGETRLFWYDEALDRLRMEGFMKNLSSIGAYYTWNDTEREVFPVLFRYMNFHSGGSPWAS